MQNSWKWFIYNRAQNVNRDNSEAGPVKKKLRTEESTHPIVPVSANDEESNKRNTDLLRNESLKPKPRYDVMKELIVRTYPSRRQSLILNSPRLVSDILKDIPAFKKCTYVRL